MASVDKNECLINGVQYKCRTCFDPGRTIYHLTDAASNKKTWLDLLKDIAQLQVKNVKNISGMLFISFRIRMYTYGIFSYRSLSIHLQTVLEFARMYTHVYVCMNICMWSKDLKSIFDTMYIR